MSILSNQLIEIYNQTLNGGMVITGNTLHVVGEKNNLSREFITLNGSYTLDWTQNGSSAYLEIPNGSIVVYAILEWFSTISNNNSNLDLISQYKPVNFKTPKTNVTISNSNEVQYAKDNNNIYSSKWVDVTPHVNISSSGYYSLSGVPSVNPLNGLDNNNKCGWTLTVVYQNSILPSRQICIYSGMKVVDPSMDKISNAITLSNINIPNVTVGAYLTMVVVGGTPNNLGGVRVYDDISKINNSGVDYSLGNYLSANGSDLGLIPIVPYDNLFSGTIVNTNIEAFDYGKLDKRGTLGDKNNNPYNINNQISFRGNRSQLDILSFDISDKIIPNQNKILLVADQIQNSDFNFGLVYGVQINKNVIEKPFPDDGGPLLNINNFSNCNIASVGDIINITLSIINKGPAFARNVTLFNNIIPGSSFLSNSLYLNGANMFFNTFPKYGFNLGDIAPTSAIIIEYSIYFYQEAFKNPVYASNSVKYSYIDNNNINKSNIINAQSSQIVILKNPLDNIKLYVNRYDVISEDVIMYTIMLENTGDITAANIQVQDLLPNGLSYINGSLSINGLSISGDLSNPVTIPKIYPNTQVSITFKAKVI